MSPLKGHTATVVRSIRIPREMDQLFHQEAQQRRVTYNALVLRLFQKYLEWDRFAEKFGFVQIPSELFAASLKSMGADKAGEIGKEFSRLVKESILFWFKKFTLETFLDFNSLIFRYSLGPAADYDERIEGREHVISIHHHFGADYSSGAAVLIGTALTDLVGIKPHVELGEGSIVLRFTEP
jgi:hypothetical protein